MLDLTSIDCIFYDFDGVFTDNKVILDETGKESVVCNRSDGMAVSMLKKAGITQLIVSTEKNPVASFRAKKLGIPCHLNVENKAAFLDAYALENHINFSRSVYFGNDINDLEAMKKCGTKVCPSDAYQEIKDIADVITNRVGGQGVIREFYDLISRES